MNDVNQFPPELYVRRYTIMSSAVSTPGLTLIGTSASVTILIPQDTPFEAVAINVLQMQSGVKVTNTGNTFQLSFAAATDQVGNIAFPADALAGNGERPNYLPTPQIFGQQTSITGTLTLNIAAASTTFVLYLVGNKLFKRGQS